MKYSVSVEALNLKTVKAVHEEVMLNLALAKDIHIDLSRVDAIDTAGIASMLCWIKYAREKNIVCDFELSDAIQSVLSSYQFSLP
ncbi:STAS domain-containing protein [Candidatus Synchoanobacter obligatus]|uniref:STAS domain-containing protein n=1 Tax=Candidatus Synchoanobacter obligatus TaxID=2919597 RepID=A0ABT1L566_9GAMM|nr:STAS domain-containing protein [Candidatus Synchoanobacter obligatus]MCP8352317.1 STAS domain-containing protein [Candidatus Synchoanobacter obligatus]